MVKNLILEMLRLRLRIKELVKHHLLTSIEVLLLMRDKVKHLSHINIEVLLRIKELVKHHLLINIEVHLPMQDRVKHLKQDGMELYHNSGLQHLLVDSIKVKERRGTMSLFFRPKYMHGTY